MSGNDFKSKISKLDSFWDLDSLVVKKGITKKPTDTVSRFPSRSEQESTETREGEQRTHRLSEISVGDKDESTTIKRYIIPRSSNVSVVPEREYLPTDSLIHNVKIYPWSADYNYYEDFYRDIKKYYNIHVESAEPVPFFSYVPQYSQMNKQQARWYFYFRTRARAGEYISCDYSYILLYCFELITSAELCEPGRIIEELARVWKNYRRSHPQLNKYLSEWIVDFGLMNAVPFPKGVLGAELSELMQYSTLKEFYASSVYRDKGSFVKLILQFCSAYDHKRSRYYESNAALYDDFIERTLGMLFDRGLLEGFSTEDCTITRQAFIGALVAYNIKKKIEIGYCSFSRTNEFRYVVGDIVKYCENKIRAHVSIKSKLSVFSLDDEIRRSIDEFAAGYFANVEKPRRARESSVNEYDKLYDVPKKPFSLAEAREIESASWATTERLVEAFADQGTDMSNDLSAPSEAPSEEPKGTQNEHKADSAFARYKDFLLLVLRRDYSAQRAYARAAGVMLEALADEINDLAVELYGDVWLEECDGGYAPIEDYIALIENEVG